MVSNEGYAVELRSVAKRYADIVAVDSMDLDVRRGEIFGLLGPNGSGKSTTLRMILGLVKPDSGSVKVLGINAQDDSVTVKRQVGYVPESSRLYEFLTGLEYLDFIGEYDKWLFSRDEAEDYPYLRLSAQTKTAALGRTPQRSRSQVS